MTDTLALDPEALYFLPLGGSGEIGMNLNLYGCRGKWLMVDLGITFADAGLPGVNVIVPDPAFIEAHAGDLLGLVLTHAHEDHLGAVPYLWPRLRCPVYATPVTAAVLRGKLADAELLDQVPLIEVPRSGRLSLDPFAIEFVSVAHSIPEANALIIRTPFGDVLHTGDWKLDPEPLVGGATDEAALRAAGDRGLLAMICDSTNVLREGESGSEAAVRERLVELVGRCDKGLAVTQFASNIARMASVAHAAQASGRELVLVGRALWRYAAAAQQTGYLDESVRLLREEEGAELRPRDVLYLCTGCQGEPRAAMAGIAADTRRAVKLTAGDTVIFSSKVIPGNERAIVRVHNRLVRRGIAVIAEEDAAVHVSGHPCRDEMARMYRWARPRIAVPVHGEARHLSEHAAFAERLQVPESVVIGNGDVLRLAPGSPEVVEAVHAGRLAVDGTRLVPPDHASIRARRRLMQNGVVFIALVLDRGGKLVADPNVAAQGIIDTDEDAPARAEVAAAARAAIGALRGAQARDVEAIREAARVTARRALLASHSRRPVIDVQIVRV